MNPGTSLCVFDDYIIGATPVYTALEHGDALARSDQLALHAVVTEPYGYALRLAVQIEHSRDGTQDDLGPNVRGSRWQPLSSSPELDGPIDVATNNLSGGEPWPARPRHRYLRLRIQLTGGRITTAAVSPSVASARVAVYVTARTRTRSSPSRALAKSVKTERRALAELQQLVAEVRGLSPLAQRDHVLAKASPATVAQLRKAAGAIAQLEAEQVARMRRGAEAVLELLKDAPSRAAPCEPCAGPGPCESCGGGTTSEWSTTSTVA